MYIVERLTPETCRFVVVNTDPHAGLEFHESHAQRPGKLMYSSSPHLSPSPLLSAPPSYSFRIKLTIIHRYKTCMALDNIPLHKVLDDALWACLLKLQVYPSKQNTPDKVYDLLLPYVASPRNRERKTTQRGLIHF